MRISTATLNRKIASFMDQLQSDDAWVVLYPHDMSQDRAKTIATAMGWKGAAKDVFYPCFSLGNVVVRRLS
jgi:hypothetical protein